MTNNGTITRLEETMATLSAAEDCVATNTGNRPSPKETSDFLTKAEVAFAQNESVLQAAFETRVKPHTMAILLSSSLSETIDPQDPRVQAAQTAQTQSKSITTQSCLKTLKENGVDKTNTTLLEHAAKNTTSTLDFLLAAEKRANKIKDTHPDQAKTLYQAAINMGQVLFAQESEIARTPESKKQTQRD